MLLKVFKEAEFLKNQGKRETQRNKSNEIQWIKEH